uniref:Ig-like domain-containing protein n=1 Tax=Astyanax mexicanus TaxID=7994 RepID=A0A8B9JIK2_ASTMX
DITMLNTQNNRQTDRLTDREIEKYVVTSVLHQKPAVLSVKAGEAVTLRCSFEEQKMNERMVWYKQKPGQAPQNVGSLIANIKIISLEFEKSGIKLERTSNSISLIIPNTTKHDEGTYFCGFSQISTVQFSTGTFLTVTGNHYIYIFLSVHNFHYLE